MSKIEEEFSLQIRLFKLPEPEREFRFDSGRRWRFDFCWPEHMIAVECEGGIWNGGRHTTGSGFTADCEKYNRAAQLGYRVFRFTGDMVKSGYAIKLMEQMLKEP